MDRLGASGLVFLAPLFLTAATAAGAATLTVVVKETRVRKQPAFYAAALQTASLGERLSSDGRSGDWYRVAAGSAKGWVHASAVTPRKVRVSGGSEAGSGEVSAEEVTLAGKGFNADVEKSYRKKRPQANFDAVDAMEARQIPERRLAAFMKAGALLPKGLRKEPLRPVEEEDEPEGAASSDAGSEGEPEEAAGGAQGGGSEDQGAEEPAEEPSARRLGGGLWGGLARAAARHAVKRGVLTGTQVRDIERAGQSVKRTGRAFQRSRREFSESEEYFIGRAVAASLLAKHPPLDDEALNEYVQSVGQVVAMASERPVVYNGYHFQVVDSEEPNAFAAPGGFVFVTSGLLGLVSSEDQLACLLGHELAHVSRKHGLGTIQESRRVEAWGILAQEAGRLAKGDVQKLTDTFERSLGDIVETLVVKGYSRDKEFDADKDGAAMASRALYHPKGLALFLDKLGASRPGIGLLKTHPDSGERRGRLQDLSPPSGFRISPARRKRFKAALGSLGTEP